MHASSVGVYSPGPPGPLVEESWPREGVPGSQYSLEKAAVERELDSIQARFPRLRIVRMRPALVFKREAARRFSDFFLVPSSRAGCSSRDAFRRFPKNSRSQCVHSLDVGEAFRRAVVHEVRGAFNLATDPVLDSRALANALGTRTTTISPKVLRSLAATAFRLHLAPSEPGWIDSAFGSPLLCSRRARDELLWRPRFDSVETLLELLKGIRTARAAKPRRSPRAPAREASSKRTARPNARPRDGTRQSSRREHVDCHETMPLAVNESTRTPSDAARRIVRVDATPLPTPGFIGEGHEAVEVLSSKALLESDPFVLLMDDRLDIEPRRAIGGPHPHAGLETVTLVLEGSLVDREEGEFGAGDAVWMTAGRGVIHNEHVEVEGRARVLQLWIGLPKRARFEAPALQVLRESELRPCKARAFSCASTAVAWASSARRRRITSP